MHRFSTVVLTAVMVLALALPSRAEVVVGSSLEWRTCKAERVVVGRVEKVTSTPAPKEVGDIVYHEITALVQEIIKGKVDARVVFYLRSHRTRDDALPAAWLRSKEPTLLFLSTSHKTDINIDGKLVADAFDLAAPGREAFDARGDILAKKDAILTICRDTAKKQVDHLKQHPYGRVVEKRISADDTPAGKVLYAGSATYLRIPEFTTGDKQPDPVPMSPITQKHVSELVTRLGSRDVRERPGALMELERLLPKAGRADDTFKPLVEPLFALCGWGGLAQGQARLAEELLVRIGQVARPLLEQRLSADDSHDRRVAVELLVRVGPKDADLAGLLQPRLTDPDGYVRKAAIEGLGALGHTAAKCVADLERVAVGDPILLRRVGATQALILVDGASDTRVLALAEFVAMKELPQNLDEGPKGEERQSLTEAGIFAAAALGEFGAKAAAAKPVLVTALKQTASGVRVAAANALGRLGADDAVPELVALLKKDPEREARRVAASALGALGSKATPAIPALRTALREEKERGWWVAADALGRIGGADAVTALGEGLTNADPDVRLTAVHWLGELAGLSKPAVGALEKVRDGDPLPRIRAAATEALRKIARTAPE